MQRDIADPEDASSPISDEQAKKLTKWASEDVVGRPFDEQVVQSYHQIGKKVLEVASNLDSNNDNLVKVAVYLHPLLSQDHCTVDMGWDLEEYMDWYFKDTSRKERENSSEQLINSW